MTSITQDSKTQSSELSNQQQQAAANIQSSEVKTEKAGKANNESSKQEEPNPAKSNSVTQKKKKSSNDLDESEQEAKLDWADATATEAEERAALTKTSQNSSTSLTESQLAKKARQKAKQKEKRAARKAVSSVSNPANEGQSTSLPTSKAEDAQSVKPAADDSKREKEEPTPTQASQAQVVRSQESSTNRGRGRGSAFGRGFAPVFYRGRGRGAFAGRGGFPAHHGGPAFASRKVATQQQQPPVEWPNGISPPTMPRAQREELERKRLAQAAAANGDTRSSDKEPTSATRAADSSPSRSGTVTPATTVTSSSPHVPGGSEHEEVAKVQEKPQVPTSTGGPPGFAPGSYRGNAFRRGRGGFSGFRGRGGGTFGHGGRASFVQGVAFPHHGAAHSRGSQLQFGSITAQDSESTAVAPTLTPSDPRQEAVGLVAGQDASADVVVRLPGARGGDGGVHEQASSSPATVPAGFAVDAQGLVWDLRQGQPLQLGARTDPSVQSIFRDAQLDAQSEREPLPPHMRALFGQSSPQPPTGPRATSQIPASAARAAAFKPSQAAPLAPLDDAGSFDPHDPTVFQPYDYVPFAHSPPQHPGQSLPMMENYDYQAYGEPGHPHVPFYYQQQDPYYANHHQVHDQHYTHNPQHSQYHHQYSHPPPNSHPSHHVMPHSHSFGTPGEVEYAGHFEGMTPFEYYDPQTGAAMSEFDPSVGVMPGGDAFYAPPPPPQLASHHHHHQQQHSHDENNYQYHQQNIDQEQQQQHIEQQPVTNVSIEATA
ncbi:unnamed protein product [Sympodiomycopsis kandeliae]